MGRLRAEDSLLLVIDMQERLQPLIHDDARVRAKAAALAAGCDLLDVPVLVTEQYPKGLGRTVAELEPAVAAAGAPMEKTEFSCAANDAVRSRIEAMRRPDILLAGIEAHICVMQTALDLLERGYRVLVVEDAVGSRAATDRDVGLSRMRRHGAEGVSVEMVLFELMGGSRHPSFKDVQALVK